MTEVPAGLPEGNLDLSVDKDGNLWLGMMYQGAIAKFDPKTEKFQYLADPAGAQQGRLAAQHGDERTATSTARSGSTTPAPRPSSGSISPPASSRSSIRSAMLPGGRAELLDLRRARRLRRTTSIVTDFQKNYLVRIDAKTAEVHRLSDRHAALAQPARPHRRAGPLLVRAISRQQDHDVRHQGREDAGVPAADQVHASL